MDKSLWNGWHIYYLDSKGTVIDNYTSNVKDIICLASVMMENSADNYEEYKNLVDDIWEGMIPIITIKESEIYHTIYSTDTFPLDGGSYYCNDTVFYEKYQKAEKEGVCFYDSITTEQSTTPNISGCYTFGSGCEYKEWYELEWSCNKIEYDYMFDCNTKDCSHECKEVCVNGCIHIHQSNCCSKNYHIHSSSNGCYEKEWYREYDCPGHSALHCSYGYRDINIYVTLLSKDDVYVGTTTSEKTIMTYLAPTNFNVSVLETKTAIIKYETHLDGYRKRIESFFEERAWDYEKHGNFAYMDSSTGSLTCDIPKLNQDGSFIWEEKNAVMEL